MAAVTIEDLSGTSTAAGGNPYQSLIDLVENDPAQMQARYEAHRVTRNSQQKAKILDPTFFGWVLDPYLRNLDGPLKDSSYKDPRNCLVFWARPPVKLRALIHDIQQKLLTIAPYLWLMPLPNLHMTTLEITHSLTAPEIDSLASTLRPIAQNITNFPFAHRARLIKPMLSYDAAAVALSFLPACGENLPPAAASDANDRTAQDDNYTYHHLRRDVFDLCSAAGVTVASRYVVPSAHLTIVRFNSPNVFEGGAGPEDGSVTLDLGRRERWIEKIEEVNAWLKEEFWPKGVEGEEIGGKEKAGQWIVGEEQGLDFHKGTLWYGGGERILLGEGF